MLQVMIALGLLGIVITVFSGLVTQTTKAQKIARIYSEKVNLQTLFRGSLTCATSCADLKRDIPLQIGKWQVRPVCSSRKLVLNVAHPDIYNGKFTRLYKIGQEDSVCKTVVMLPPSRSGNRRKVCNYGQKVTHVNFTDQTIQCR